MEQVYVLQLANNKYYVGKTTDVMKRFNEHKSGSGSAWTKLHAPKKILECRPLNNDHDENNLTKDYMKKYGIENVRGGAYTQTSLPDHVKTVLNTELRSNKDTCYKCGEAGHFANACGKTVNSYDSSEEEEQSMVVEFMNVHVRRNKLKLSMNHLRRSLEHVIVVDAQVIIHLIVMQEPIQTVMNWSKNGLQSTH
jgi:predicted GIY-YIG superfamily endonuclease